MHAKKKVISVTQMQNVSAIMDLSFASVREVMMVMDSLLVNVSYMHY